MTFGSTAAVYGPVLSGCLWRYLPEATDDIDGVMASFGDGELTHEIIPSPVGVLHERQQMADYYRMLFSCDQKADKVTLIRRLYGDDFLVDETLWEGDQMDGKPFLLPGKSGRMSISYPSYLYLPGRQDLVRAGLARSGRNPASARLIWGRAAAEKAVFAVRLKAAQCTRRLETFARCNCFWGIRSLRAPSAIAASKWTTLWRSLNRSTCESRPSDASRKRRSVTQCGPLRPLVTQPIFPVFVLRSAWVGSPWSVPESSPGNRRLLS